MGLGGGNTPWLPSKKEKRKAFLVLWAGKKEKRKAFLVLWAGSLVLLMQTQSLCAMEQHEKLDVLSTMKNSERLRDHNYYKEELRKLEESTRRIHQEVDRILAHFRRNMEEYYQRTRGAGTAKTVMPKILQASRNAKPIQTIEVDAHGNSDLENLQEDHLQSIQKEIAQAGVDLHWGKGKYKITGTAEKGGFGVVYLTDTPDAIKVSNGKALKDDLNCLPGLCRDELDRFLALDEILIPKKDRFNLKICLPHTKIRVKLKNNLRYNSNFNVVTNIYEDSWNIQIMDKIKPTRKMEDIIKSAANREEGGLKLLYNLGKDLGEFQSCFLDATWTYCNFLENGFNRTFEQTIGTMVHGDFSYRNILYTGDFNVIDNASMGLHQNRTIFTDPIYFIHSLAPQLTKTNKENKKSLLQSFYNGYMSQFNNNKIKAEVKSRFDENQAYQLAVIGTHYAFPYNADLAGIEKEVIGRI